MSPSEARFHEAMLDVYRNARQRCNYNATYFLQMVSEIGGLATARKLLQRSEPSSGFAELWQCGAVGLAVEAQGLRPEAADLFRGEERAIERRRLAEYGVVGGDKNNSVRLLFARLGACYTAKAGR